MIASVFIAVLGFANLTPEGAAQDALLRSPEVAVAQARVAQSASLLAAARDALFPALTSTYQQLPQGNPPGPNIISRLVSVGLQTNVADFIAYGPTVRQNVLGLAASRADAAVAQRGERIKTLGLYFDALKARAIAAARDRALGLALAQRDAARKRFAAGVAPKLDVVRADVAIGKATADDEAARVVDQNATSALAVETGHSADELQPTVELPRATASPVAADPSALATRALSVRAEVASALAAEHAAEAARRAVAAARFPALSITGGYTAGTDSDVPIGAPSLNVALTVPLGPASAAKAAVEGAKIAEAHARTEGAKRSVVLEVSAAARTLGALERAAAASTQARRGAEIEVAATELGYTSGASSSLEVTTARSIYAQALVDELSALYDLEKARAALTLQVGT